MKNKEILIVKDLLRLNNRSMIQESIEFIEELEKLQMIGQDLELRLVPQLVLKKDDLKKNIYDIF